LAQGDLNDVDSHLPVSKKAEPSGSRIKCWDLFHQDTDIHFFRNRENEFKELFSQEKICNLLMTFVPLYRLMGTNPIEMSGVCLLTLQKSV
jgi:hypothetical protein